MENSPLRHLPREIKDRIYTMVLQQDHAINLFKLKSYTALAETCREERAAALACVFRVNKLFVPYMCKLHKLQALFESLGTELVLKMKYLRFSSASESDRRILVDAEFQPDTDAVQFIPSSGNDECVAKAYKKIGLRLVEVETPEWSKYGWFAGKTMKPCPC